MQATVMSCWEEDAGDGEYISDATITLKEKTYDRTRWWEREI